MTSERGMTLDADGRQAEKGNTDGVFNGKEFRRVAI